MTQTVGKPVICALNIALNLVNEPTQSSQASQWNCKFIKQDSDKRKF